MALADIQELERNEAGIAEAILKLRMRFGDRLNTGFALREQHGDTITYLPNQPPDAVIFAETTEEIQEIVRICAVLRVPVIPFGTGTSLEGGVNAPAGGICIDLSRMDAILDVHAEDFDVVVQPGVTREALNAHLRDTGLFFPVDPGANASLGGMASTRASGTNAVRYGTMRENVINVTAILPDGRQFATAKRAQKSSSGYDLTHLLVGAEGTLGIISELTLRLHPIPEAISAAICSFPDVGAACEATIEAKQAGIPLARVELLDADCVRAINAYSKSDYPVAPLLLLEFHGSEIGVREQAEMFGLIAKDRGGAEFVWVTGARDLRKLWKARHEVYFAMSAAASGDLAIANDVCVPISRLADCVNETEQDLAASKLYGPILGHVGDGNFHVGLFIDRDNPQQLAKAEAFISRLALRALSMEGTCTGEHGIGQGKRHLMRIEHGAGVDVMLAIKNALDPHNIMNPAKILPNFETGRGDNIANSVL